MNKRHNQRNILQRMDKLRIHGPLMSDSRMAFISWLIDQFDEGHEEPEKLKEKQVRQSLYHLEKKKFIKKTIFKSGKVIFELTKSGKAYSQTQDQIQEIRDLELTLPSKWDKKWHFAMFDIPKKYNYRRDIFRDKLKKSGFFRAQQSVWVFPYDCGVEIDNLLESLRIQDYVLQFVGEVKDDGELKEYFKEQGFNL